MSSERDILALFERANPVPDPDRVAVEPDAGQFLADLLGESPAAIGEGVGGAQPAGHRNRWLIPMVAAVVAVVVAGLVVLSGGATEAPAPADTVTTIASSPTTEPSEETVPTSTVAPEVPVEDLPTLRSGQTQATSIGDITLTRVEGDAASLPAWVDFEYDGAFYGSGYDTRSNWRSDDGITWTQIDPTGAPPLSTYVESGGDVWTSVESYGIDQRPQLLRFDGSTFTSVQLPDLAEPDIPGLRPDRRSLLLTPFRGELAIIASTAYTIDFTDGFDFGDDVDASALRVDMLDEDTMRVTSSNSNEDIERDYDVVVDQGEPGTVQFVSPEGTVVGRVGPWPGLDAEQLHQRLVDQELTHHQILIGSDAGFDVVTGPRPDVVVQSLADVDGQLLAVTYTRRHYVVEEFSLWSTSDFTNWIPIESPVLDDEHPMEAVLFGNGSDAILVTVDRAWSTHDAQTWQPLEESGYGATFAADFGWVTVLRSPSRSEDSSASSVILAVSSDSTAWERVPLDCSIPGLWTSSPAVLGDKIFVGLSNEPDTDTRLLCIATVGP